MAENSTLGEAEILWVQALRFCKHRRTKLSQKMVADLMARFRGCLPIGREDIWKLGEVVRDEPGSREKGSTETGGGGRSRQGKADLRGNHKMPGKTLSDWLKKPVKPVGAKT